MDRTQSTFESRRRTLWISICAVLVWGIPCAGSDDQLLRYNQDVRPILADNCFRCHGPDSASREAGLRLDQFDAAIEMGAIVPGVSDESELLRRIASDDPDERMPPPETQKQVTAEQYARLQRWIEQGATYQPHWSLLPPTRPPAPKLPAADVAWTRNPIDSFVLARLAAHGLRPSPEADRRTLARRVALDLTGLPPAPALVESFVHDESPDAYERLVDELLAAPAWGEHRARYWLDYARYADTHGIHFDNYREMWSYRDWVIDAFNKNLPFDQFTVESLAGDLLPNPSMDQLIASGFNRCNITTNEGGIIAEEYLVLYTRDRAETTAQVWLGLTAGCAVCHSHKFDPLSHREFYQLAAFFNNTTQAAMDGNVPDTPPVVTVPRPADEDRWLSIDADLELCGQQIADRGKRARPDFEQWLTSDRMYELTESVPTAGLQLHAPLNEGTGTETRIELAGESRTIPLSAASGWQDSNAGGHAVQVQGSALEVAQTGNFDSDQAFSCSAWVYLPANDTSGAILARMDDRDNFRGWDMWVQQRRIGMHIIRRWPEKALKTVAKEQVPANQWVHVTVTYDGSRSANGVHVYYDGQRQATNLENNKLGNETQSTRTDVPFRVGQRTTQNPFQGGVHDVRLYERSLRDSEIKALAGAELFAHVASLPAAERLSAASDVMFGWWLESLDAEYRLAAKELENLEREKKDIAERGTIAHVMNERTDSATAYVLHRGEYDQRREQITPDTPAALPPFPTSLPRNRLGFARWLLQPEHPLTARVTVNRCWQEIFGTGLVRTAGDFGVMGELPSHPQLLDFLAVEFRESGWDLKALYRLIVTSATYRQSAVVTADRLAEDPSNRLFSRGPRFRMDAEMVRDYALAASGLLNRRIGGPSVKPYQPPGVWEAVAMTGSNTRNYGRNEGESLYRRSMYTFWKRAAPPASMDIFNAPSRETCTVCRERTNTPLQALTTLNDEQFVEAARVLAQRTIRQAGPDDYQRLDFVYRRLLSRPLQAEELQVTQDSLVALRTHYGEFPADAAELLQIGDAPVDSAIDPVELAAWTMLTNELMNLDEVLTK